MPSIYSRIALLVKGNSPEADEVLQRLAEILHKAKIEVWMQAGEASRLRMKGCKEASMDELPMHVHMAVVAGGDGTMLHAARAMAPHKIPLVGINLGRLGFLTDCSAENMERDIADLLAGNFTVEPRAMLELSLNRQGRNVGKSLALNDVWVMKGSLGRVIEMDVKVGKHVAYTLRADGLLVSTPTGSTAYALSASGPILPPSVNAMLVVPLYPHVLSCRPLVVPDSEIVTIELHAENKAAVHADGMMVIDIVAGDVLTVSRSAHHTQLLHPPGHDYFAVLRSKLHWG